MDKPLFRLTTPSRRLLNFSCCVGNCAGQGCLAPVEIQEKLLFNLSPAPRGIGGLKARGSAPFSSNGSSTRRVRISPQTHETEVSPALATPAEALVEGGGYAHWDYWSGFPYAAADFGDFGILTAIPDAATNITVRLCFIASCSDPSATGNLVCHALSGNSSWTSFNASLGFLDGSYVSYIEFGVADENKSALADGTFGMRLELQSSYGNAFSLDIYGVWVEIDYEFSSGLSDTKEMTGGCVSGGAAAFSVSRSPAVAGGLASSGHAPVASDRLLAGGVVLGGSASSARQLSAGVSGGLFSDGAASIVKSLVPAVAGGLLAAGLAILAMSITPSGGAVLGGQALVARSFNGNPTGDMTTSGGAAFYRTSAPPIDGGMIALGVVDPSKALVTAPAGGMATGGEAAWSTQRADVFLGSGEMVVSGHGSLGEIRVLHGGTVMGGEALPSAAVFAHPQGGLISDGAASFAMAVSFEPAGGITAGGQAPIVQAFFGNPTGDIQSGGQAIVLMALSASPQGGLDAGGHALLDEFRPVTGGIVLSGAHPVEEARAISGGVTLGGAAAFGLARTGTPDGGVLLSGLQPIVLAHAGHGSMVLSANTAAIRQLVKTVSGGVMLGGAAEVSAVLPFVDVREGTGGMTCSGIMFLQAGTYAPAVPSGQLSPVTEGQLFPFYNPFQS